MDRIPDPYRELGVLRGATDAQVKAAHRRLAKRFHPDAPEGDTERFLSIQEAYLLLSDPLRRRDWDAAHAPGPVRAGDPAKPRGRGAGAPPRARTAGSGGRGAAGPTGKRGAGGPGAGAAGAAGGGERERAGAAWSASDREPASRSTTWSAAGVPWWEDFAPRDRTAGSASPAGGDGPTGTAEPVKGSGGTARGGSPRGGRAPAGSKPAEHAETQGKGGATGSATGPGAQRSTAQRSPEDVDVYSRSSGAAWSMAARRYFRKGEAELPKGGSWTYRGTQVVTGGEARKVAAEQAAERRKAADELLRSRAPGPTTAPRTAFAHEPPGSGRATASGSPTTTASGPPTTARPPTKSSAVPPARPITPPPPPPSPPDAPPSSGDPSLLGRMRRALRRG